MLARTWASEVQRRRFQDARDPGSCRVFLGADMGADHLHPAHGKMSKKKSILDSLCGDLSEDEGEEEKEKEEPEVKKPKVGEISFEELEERGYKAKSVLLMKEPVEEHIGWGWSDGRAAKSKETARETSTDRATTRDAATRGAEETALHSIKAQELAARLQEERRQEKREQHQMGHLRVKDKEKRKREEGKQSSGKSTVEEEKRIARTLGVYSGFD